MVRQERQVKQRYALDDCSILREEFPSDRLKPGRTVYFHENHVCQDGVCEYRPRDIRGTLVRRELYGGMSQSPGWVVEFAAGQELVRSQGLFWHQREGVKLIK